VITITGIGDNLGPHGRSLHRNAQQVEPDPLDRIEFRAGGRQRHEREIIGDGQCALVVSAGTVEHEHSMGVGQCGGELRQNEVHHCRTDDGQPE